jgi:ADP-dependent NAD(P)H-hydrate dehydratase / NAD(P)H-hydrate epimerase
MDAREQRRLDLNAEALGVSVETLMDNAGKAVAREAARHARKGQPILVLCGKGNNGGDGFAATRHLLAAGHDAHAVLAEPSARIVSAAARAHFARLPRSAWSVWRGRPPAAWNTAGVLVDCLLGSGLHGPPRGAYAALVRWANARRKAGRKVVSCDVPTGLGTRLAVRPNVTVALHAAHDGLTSRNAGRIRVARIGIPAAARHIGFGDAVLGYPRVEAASHKGQNGVVLVVGGCDPLAGAPHYVALGAYRTGADLVHVAVPAALAPVLRCWGPEAIVHSVQRGGHLTPDALPMVERLLDRVGAVVVGPGLGTEPSTAKAARAILEAAGERGLPMVVDADGLDALDDDLLRRHGRLMVLTPHGREFQDLAGTKATKANVAAHARRHGVVVLCKGAVDHVSDGAATAESHGGHPTMTVGGTGDVLAGILACLLSKGASRLDAARAASHIAKAASEAAANVRSHGATARDVADAVPLVVTRIEAAQQAKA